MSIVKGMPCHICASEDQFDNNTRNTEGGREERIEEIVSGLYNGDNYSCYGAKVNFSNVVDDQLAGTPAFSNALRGMLPSHSVMDVLAIEELVDKEVEILARDIYEYEAGE